MDLIGLKCLYFLILSSVLSIQVIAIEDNPVSLQLKDPSSLSSPATKNKFQTFSETFKQSITKLKKNHKKIDLVFLVDSSSSVGKVNFLSEIKFVKKVLADFTVSYNHTRVAVVTFSSALSVVSRRKLRRRFTIESEITNKIARKRGTSSHFERVSYRKRLWGKTGTEWMSNQRGDLSLFECEIKCSERNVITTWSPVGALHSSGIPISPPEHQYH